MVTIPSKHESVIGLASITTTPMDLLEEPLAMLQQDDSCEPEIYLERNLKLMKKIRDKDKHQIKNHNGLEFNMMPQTY